VKNEELNFKPHNICLFIQSINYM